MADYYDSTGKRTRKSFRTKEEADRFEARGRLDRAMHTEGSNPNPLLADYGPVWLQRKQPFLKPATFKSYETNWRVHVLPAFGDVPMRSITRARIKAFLGQKLEERLDRLSVGTILAILRNILNEAREDGILQANPAAALGRRLKLWPTPSERTERVRAMKPEEVGALLDACRGTRYHPLFLLLATTGMRISEALGLQWQDVDHERHELRLQRKWSAEGRVETPKSGYGRTVDLTAEVCASIAEHRRQLSEEWMRRPSTDEEPRGAMPPWVFPDTRFWEPYDQKFVRETFRRFCLNADVLGRYSPKSLRHTYASQMLAMGWSPAYVQEQLGHATIEMTVSTYGRWLRKRAPGAVENLLQSFRVRGGQGPTGHEMRRISGGTQGNEGPVDYRREAERAEKPEDINPYLPKPAKGEGSGE